MIPLLTVKAVLTNIAQLFDFLSCFPFRERIAEAVVSGVATTEDIFPPGKIFQAKYAAFALQFKLRERLRKASYFFRAIWVFDINNRYQSILDDSFLANAIQLLDKALLNHALLSPALTGTHELHLAACLVAVLLEFLKGMGASLVQEVFNA